MSIPRVILRPKRAQPFFGRHPWVYPGAIQSVEGNPADGAEVELRSSAGNFVARGFYNSKSKIRVRLYSWTENEPLDEVFFRKRFESALRLRRTLLGQLPAPKACRLIASEADGVSGLIVDRFDRWLTVQFTSLALAQRRDWLTRLLVESTGASGLYLRTERGIGKLEGLDVQDGPLWGDVPSEPVEITEGPVRYLVDIRAGQKTGFFLDQRTNRQVAARYLNGRDVLDCFCYTGGFGLHAAKGGAKSITAVDISESALQLARRNAELNGLTDIRFHKADVFDYLTELLESDRKFGGIVLDPPKFARNREAVPDALRGYRILMQQALRLLENDGILMMCCCSGLITSQDIEEVLAQVAVDGNCQVQILERRGQDVDHPISVTCPETGYLKCLICRVAHYH
jgi:23S rRNA (cytosine1962-C5)-methyltransferase